jgi:hypothetical protein
MWIIETDMSKVKTIISNIYEYTDPYTMILRASDSELLKVKDTD